MSGFHPYQAVLRQHLEGVELVLLEAAYNDDQLKCQSTHDRGAVACSVTVTHRVTHNCGHAPRLICTSAAERNLSNMADPTVECIFCGDKARRCWDVWPV